MPIWDFESTIGLRKINQRSVKIEEQLIESLNIRFGQRHVLTLARYLDTNEDIMLKIRYDVNSKSFNIEDPKATRGKVDVMFIREVEAVEAVHTINHGPRYIDHATQPAGQTFPYPDGWADLLVMSRVPGNNVAEIADQLSFEQLESIRQKPAVILEHLRKNGKGLYEQDPASEV
ncbi:hypothetical protein MW887_006476 [Aspergillus wentii]|nr:hypothetical protein MW887_006476 [Aspergillus wentii]